MPGVWWLGWDDLALRGVERVDRVLADAGSGRSLVAVGSLLAFLAEHRQELFPTAKTCSLLGGGGH